MLTLPFHGTFCVTDVIVTVGFATAENDTSANNAALIAAMEGVDMIFIINLLRTFGLNSSTNQSARQSNGTPPVWERGGFVVNRGIRKATAVSCFRALFQLRH